MTMTMERPQTMDAAGNENPAPPSLPLFRAVAQRCDLLNAMKLPVKTASRRTTLDTLRCLRLEVTGGGLTIHASDLEIETAATCPATGEGVACVDAQRLSQMIAALPEGEVRLTMQETRLEVTGGATRFLLTAMDPEHFPALSEGISEAWELPGSDLARLLGAVAVAASNDGTRPILCGISLVHGEEGLIAAATDTHNLHVAKGGKQSAPLGASILPGRSVSLLLEGLDSDRCWSVEMGTHQFHVSDGVTSLSSRLIDGVFPPYQRVIPTTSSVAWTVDAGALLATLRRLSLVAREGAAKDRVILANQGADSLLLEAESPEGKAEDRLAAECEGEELVIALDGVKLRKTLDAFAELGVETVRLQMTTAMSPLLIEAAGVGAGVLRAVIMPMQIR